MHREIVRWIAFALSLSLTLSVCGFAKPQKGEMDLDLASVGRIWERLMAEGIIADEEELFLLIEELEQLKPEHLLEPNRFKTSHEFLRQFLEIFKEELAPEHPLALRAMLGVALLHFANGEYAKAQELVEQVLPTFRDLQGAEHPETLMVIAFLAMTLEVQGDLSGARVLAEKLLETSRRVLGAEHSDTLNTMEILANTLKAQGDLPGARELFEEVLATRRRVLGLEDRSTLGAMVNLAAVLGAQGDLAGARELEGAALATSRRVLGNEDPYTLTVMLNLAVTLEAQGDLAGARELEEAVLANRRRTLGSEHPDTLTAKSNLAGTLKAQGDLRAARELLEEVLPARRRALGVEHPDTLSAVGNLAGILSALGDLAGARELEEAMLASWRRVLGEKHPDTLRAMGNLAVTLSAQGDLAGAQELEKEVFTTRRRVLGEEHPETLRAMGNLAAALEAQGDLVGARKLEEEVLATRRRILGEEHPDTLKAMENLALTLSAQGDLAGSQKLEEETLATRRRILGEEHPDTLLTMKNLAVTLYAQGNHREAKELLEDILRIEQSILGADHTPNTGAEGFTFHGLGRVHRALGHLERSATFHLQALETLEAQATKASRSEDLKSVFRARYDYYYREAILTFLDLKLPERALHTLERSRARSFLSMLAERDLIFTDIPPEIDAQRVQVSHRYDANLRKLDSLLRQEDRERLGELLKEQKDLRRERELLNAQIRSVSPQTANFLEPQPLSVDEIREALDPGTLLLSYSVGPGRTDLFTLTRGGKLDFYSLPLGERTLGDQVDRFHDRLHGHAWPELSVGRIKMGKWLFEKLLRPAVEQIGKSQRLLIVPAGPLHYLPFDALIRDAGVESETERGWQYLVEWKPIHTVLSATVYAELQKSRRGRSGGDGQSTYQLAAFGDPIYPPTDREGSPNRGPVAVRSAVARGYFAELTPLPQSEREVTEIAQLFPRSSVRKYLRNEASEEQAKTVGKDVRIVHFAVHGVADPLTPLDSFLAFTIPDDRAEGRENGLLQAWEIFERVRLDADLVVLSACQTAFGPERRGEGLISLSRAFQYAGARTVAASLWKVDDQSTAELMIRFYRNLRDGMPKDEALRAAQIELIRGPIEVPDENGELVPKDYSAPYHWAAFQVIGDWQ